MASGGLRGRLVRHLGGRFLPGRAPKLSRSPPGSEKKLLLSSGGPPETFPSEISPFQGGPGERFGLHFGSPSGSFFLATDVETAKISQKINSLFIILFLAGQFYAIFGTLLPALLHARPPREHGKILKIYWFLWVESHMRRFRATSEAIKFQRTGVAKTGRKPMPK